MIAHPVIDLVPDQFRPDGGISALSWMMAITRQRSSVLRLKREQEAAAAKRTAASACFMIAHPVIDLVPDQFAFDIKARNFRSIHK